MLSVTSYEGPTLGMPTSRDFANTLISKGCISAYALDGGQTAMIFSGDAVINRINYNQERTVSDILYFATAFPSEE
jgi:exopolysaccharide biosynthesis protein